jgi:hypothetical protein
MTMDDEINYEWEREGDPVKDVIVEAADVSDEVAEDIRRVLEDRELFEWFGSFENPFDSEAYYDDRAADDAEYRAGWLHFEESLATEARFFNPTAEAILTDTFADIDKHRTDGGLPVIREAGPKTELIAFFRALGTSEERYFKRRPVSQIFARARAKPTKRYRHFRVLS